LEVHILIALCLLSTAQGRSQIRLLVRISSLPTEVRHGRVVCFISRAQTLVTKLGSHLALALAPHRVQARSHALVKRPLRASADCVGISAEVGVLLELIPVHWGAELILSPPQETLS